MPGDCNDFSQCPVQVSCRDDQDKHLNLLAFMSSCRNLDVLPVSAQTSTPPFLVIVISVAVVVLLLAVAMFGLLVFRKLTRSQHGAVIYMHYSSQDEEMVRGTVGREVGKVVKSICYHHSDLSTQVSVGQAISSAVETSVALVITASPAYTQSAITTAELHIILDCLLQKQGHYPVIVVAPGQSGRYIQQVGEGLSRSS